MDLGYTLSDNQAHAQYAAYSWLFPGLLHTLQQRWLAARAEYAQEVKHWKSTDLSSTSATDFAQKACPISRI